MSCEDLAGKIVGMRMQGADFQPSEPYGIEVLAEFWLYGGGDKKDDRRIR